METFNCQPLLDRLTLVMVRTGALREFCKRDTPLDKIKYLMEAQVLYEGDYRINIRDEIENLLEVLYDRCADHGKCEAAAVQAKTRGSKAYMRKHDSEALRCYNECLRLAPPTSPTLPLAYANRSAVLVQEARYKDALRDLDRAESVGYPVGLRHKVLLRRAKCHAALGQVSQARKALQLLRQLDMTPECREKSEKEAVEIESSLINPPSPSQQPTNTSKESLVVPDLVCGESHLVKYLTSAFEMRENEKFGRHVVAVQDVGRGCVVFTEKPYAVLLLPDLVTSHCLTCLNPAPLPIPCDTCRDIVYCSEECRAEGTQGCHRYECRLLHLLSSVGIAHLALRILLVAGCDTYSKIRNEKIEKGRIAGMGEEEGYNGAGQDEALGRYRAVYHLMPHLDSCSPEDQLQYSLASIILAKTIMDKTDFLMHGGGVGWSVESLAAALMRHVAQLVSNAHAITRVERVASDGKGNIGKRLEEVQQRRVASAIYATASLMNHSCKPNIINSFIGDMLVIRTIEDVKEGDQIFNCYGPHYCRQTREERQEALKQQYFFTCKCAPCTQPEYMRKEAVWNGIQCESCGGVASWVGGDESGGEEDVERNGGVEAERRSVLLCIHCHKLQGPSAFLSEVTSKVSSLLEAGEAALKQGDTGRAVELLRASVGTGSGVYQQGSATMIKLRDMFAAAMAANGDYMECCDEVRECVGLTETRYGPHSVELAHELLKFTDILALAAATCENPAKYDEELKSVKKRVDDIFTLNYGPQWKLYLGTE